MLSFPNRLKELRFKNNMTQEQLALQMGLTKSVVSAYETGARMPSVRALLALSSIFHVSVDYLLNNESKNIYSVDLSGLSYEERMAITTIIKAIKWLQKRSMSRPLISI